MEYFMKLFDSRKTSTRGGLGINYFITILLISLSYEHNFYGLDVIANYAHYLLVIERTVADRDKPILAWMLICAFLKVGWMCPFMHAIFAAKQNGTLKKAFIPYVENAYNSLKSLYESAPSVAYPLAGVNSSWEIPEPLVDMWNDFKRELISNIPEVTINEIMSVQVEANYLRPVGKSVSVLDLSDRPKMSPGESYEYAKKLMRMQRVTGWMLVILLGIVLIKSPSFLIGVALYIVYSLLETQVNTVIAPKRGITTKDGSYFIRYKMFGITMSHGIGVSHNGVLHIPYHVVGNSNVGIGKSILQPFYINIEEDLVTYGGPPQFKVPMLGQEVLVNIETEESRTTYKTRVDVDASQRILTWINMTVPGNSGSPMYIEDDDGMHLVTLVGRWVTDTSGISTGYAKLPDSSEDSSGLQQIITHPGSGKTRRLLPDLVLSQLGKRKNKRVLVCGPTRVVCREIYAALRKRVPVGLNIRDENILKDRHAAVQIASHHTAMTMLLTDAPEVRNLGCVIIDEAHVDDAATIMLRNYGRHLMDAGVKLIEMSATLDGKTDKGSNYPIEDKLVDESELYKAAREHLREGRKVLVFVPGIRGKEAAEYKKMDNVKRVLLSRDTYQAVHQELNHEDTKLIISTDIAECGINIRNLDVVIDHSAKFGYVMENNIIYGKRRPYPLQSMVQRRGRVGREKPGIYYYCREPSDVQYDTAASIDANIMMSGQGWAGMVYNPLGIYLSNRQIELVLQKMLLPTQVAVTTRSDGTQLNTATIIRNLEQLKNGNSYHMACTNNCNCGGKYRWFDERMHDLHVKLSEPVPIMPM